MKQIFNGYNIFEGRTMVIATMHEKEKVIAPLLQEELGVNCKTIPNLNTDNFGTFSGEIERANPPLQTARIKAIAGLDLSDESLGIASEGSFGAHPSSPFIAANEELVILIDTKNNLEIVGRYLTVETNFSHRVIKNSKDLESFKTAIGYPEHGIILKITDKANTKTIHKNFRLPTELDSIVHEALKTHQIIHAETDMRAIHNPTRMLAIKHAVIDLIKNILSVCPECKTPGFAIQNVIRGLPCELCHLPTKSAKAYIHWCQKCNFSNEREKDGSKFEDPIYCDYCNP